MVEHDDKSYSSSGSVHDDHRSVLSSSSSLVTVSTPPRTRRSTRNIKPSGGKQSSVKAKPAKQGKQGGTLSPWQDPNSLTRSLVIRELQRRGVGLDEIRGLKKSQLVDRLNDLYASEADTTVGGGATKGAGSDGHDASGIAGKSDSAMSPTSAATDLTPVKAANPEDAHPAVRRKVRQPLPPEEEKPSPSGAAPPPLTVEVLRTFKVERLKAELRNRKLKVSGTKPELQRRLASAEGISLGDEREKSLKASTPAKKKKLTKKKKPSASRSLAAVGREEAGLGSASSSSSRKVAVAVTPSSSRSVSKRSPSSRERRRKSGGAVPSAEVFRKLKESPEKPEGGGTDGSVSVGTSPKSNKAGASKTRRGVGFLWRWLLSLFSFSWLFSLFALIPSWKGLFSPSWKRLQVLYIIFLVGVKFFVPNAVAYVAHRTYLASMISLWYPLMQTVFLVHKHRGLRKKRERTMERVGGAEGGEGDGAVSPRRGSGKRRRRRSSAKKEDADGEKKEGESMHEESEEGLAEEASEWLKYWVVHALLFAVCQTLYMVPVIGRILTDVTSSSTDGTTAGGRLSVSGWFTFLLSTQSLQEMRLAFFVWLCLLPSLLAGKNDVNTDIMEAKSVSDKTDDNSDKEKTKDRTDETAGDVSNEDAIPADETANGHDTKSKTQINTKDQTLTADQQDENPVDVLYGRLTPLALSMLNSSSTITKRTADNASNEEGGILNLIMRNLESVLDACVLIRLVKPTTKDRIVTTLIESAALLPAFVTLVMPGLIQYGILYVRAVVPSANSALAYRELRNETEEEGRREGVAVVMRYLQYWIVHAMVFSVVSLVAPYLAWIPLGTQVVFLLWSYCQLESTTLSWYGVLEAELMAFGLLHCHEGNEAIDVDKTVTVSLLRSVIDRLPSAATVSEEYDDDEEEDSDEEYDDNGYSEEEEEEEEEVDSVGEEVEEYSLMVGQTVQ